MARLFSFILLSLFLSSAGLAESTAMAKVKLALNWKPEPQFGGFYAAKFGDAFLNHGLDVEILEGGSGTPTVQMLANGKVDFAIVSAEEILISNERNPTKPLVALFTVYQNSPVVIMCHESRGLNSLKEVFATKGILALQSGLTYAQFLKEKYPSPVVKVVPYLGGIANYLNDPQFCQQGFATSEPLLASKAGKPAKVFLVADEGFNPYTTVVTVREETLKANPKLVEKMKSAIALGWSQYLKDPKPTNAKMAGLNKAMDAVTFEKSAAAQFNLIQPTKESVLGAMTKERWQTLADQLVKLKVLKKAPDVSQILQ